MSVHSRNGKILLACAAALIVALAVLLIAGSGDESSDEAQSAEAAAHDADAKTGARTAQTALEVYATDHAGAYTGATVASLREIEPTLPENLEVLFADGGSYSLRVVSESGVGYSIVRSPTGAVNRQCDPPGEGDCPDSGDW